MKKIGKKAGKKKAGKKVGADRADSRAMALLFLEEVQRRCVHYADRLDPARRRRYDEDPVLKAMDGLASMASRTLDAADPAWRARESGGALPGLQPETGPGTYRIYT